MSFTRKQASEASIITVYGERVWPLAFKPEHVQPEVVAHALAIEPRFSGHTLFPVSVGDHSLRVAREVERRAKARGWSHTKVREIVLAALLHDGSEAYLRDLPTPIKAKLPDYAAVEAVVQRAVDLRFGVPSMCQHHQLIKRADRAVFFAETRAARPPSAFAALGALDETPPDDPIEERPWREVRDEFLVRLDELRLA